MESDQDPDHPMWGGSDNADARAVLSSVFSHAPVAKSTKKNEQAQPKRTRRVPVPGRSNSPKEKKEWRPRRHSGRSGLIAESVQAGVEKLQGEADALRQAEVDAKRKDRERREAARLEAVEDEKVKRARHRDDVLKNLMKEGLFALKPTRELPIFSALGVSAILALLPAVTPLNPTLQGYPLEDSMELVYFVMSYTFWWILGFFPAYLCCWVYFRFLGFSERMVVLMDQPHFEFDNRPDTMASGILKHDHPIYVKALHEVYTFGFFRRSTVRTISVELLAQLLSPSIVNWSADSFTTWTRMNRCAATLQTVNIDKFKAVTSDNVVHDTILAAWGKYRYMIQCNENFPRPAPKTP